MCNLFQPKPLSWGYGILKKMKISLTILKLKKGYISVSLVGPAGLEPATHWLWVRYMGVFESVLFCIGLHYHSLIYFWTVSIFIGFPLIWQNIWPISDISIVPNYLIKYIPQKGQSLLHFITKGYIKLGQNIQNWTIHNGIMY